MGYIFEAIANSQKAAVKPADITAARAWYVTEAQKLSATPSRMMMDKTNAVDGLDINSIGKLYCFFYDPKHKATMPYYDIFPLVFPVSFRTDGFLGINMHYLPPVLRAKLMAALYLTINSTSYDENTALRVSYDILNRSSQFSYFKPCLKQYLWDHVAGPKFVNIEVKNWDSALLLPLERFKKASNLDVWKDSVDDMKPSKRGGWSESSLVS